MPKQVTARKESGWKVVCLAPDVCKTPMGSSTPPVPYQVVAKLEDTAEVAKSVRANGYPVVVYARSYVPQTTGDAAGSALGIQSGTVEGKCHPDEHSKNVYAEGKLLVRHDDLFWMNGK
ncbi:MAG: DUF4150 domain-containing protein [Polyangiaceae bacterium]|nr:DUF4150 domain-containing protein [Polyangiaceae bacterium]